MSIVVRALAVTICVAAFATVVVAGVGCGTGDDADTTPRWETVVSTDVSGARPAKTLLGTHHLGDRVRLSWDLSGPGNPSVMFTLRAVEITRGTGFGASVSPKDANFALHSEEVLVLGPLRPGDYRLYFSQRFPASEGPGYDVKLTISTTR